MSADWPYNCDMVPSSSMGLSSSAVCEGNEIGSSSSASGSMMNSGLDSLNWSAEGLNVGFFGIDLGNSASSLTMLEHSRGSSEVVRPMFDNEWNPLSQFPADSGFIEGTSRFSCFGGGNFSDMNPFTAPKSSSPHSKCGPVAGPDIVDGWRSLPFESEVNMVRTSKLSTECESQNGSLPRNESVTKSLIESKHGRGASSNESEEANFRGSDWQEEPCKLGDAAGGTRSARRSGTNNRKRAGQSARAIKINGVSQKLVVGEPLLRCEHKPSPGANSKADEKLDQKSQGTYTPKDDYVHVRARSGQATNSHSLAERVRREKISDRMKFLQDLVPGCSQVTGKAVMLDEIINYVESLQRQVVFLSMKLATVSSRLDFDIEGLLTKDMFQQPAGPSSSLRLPPDVGQHLIPSQTAEFQTSLPISGSSHLAAVGYIEPNIQLADTDNELHNVILVGFGVNSGEPSKCQELNDSHQSDPMKTDLGRPT